MNFYKSSHEYGVNGNILYEDKYEDDEYEKFSYDWISKCYDSLKEEGSMYIISGWTRVGDVLNALKKTKFHLVNHLIWNFSWGVFTKRKYVTSHYHILFLVKDPKKYKFFPQTKNPESKRKGEKYEEDVLFWPEYNRGNDPDRIDGHPCQLPLCLLKRLIKVSSEEKDLIGDIFSGSGGTALAARELNRNVVSIEKNKQYEEIIKKKAKFGKIITPESKKKTLNDF
ncbi:MAG: site-specific DNA-methyltransferase [Candidatus Pacearchaeota archaeon]|nr:site-specific DNA-methyltransferase [Candidatus Pacearchaeota archaeon]